MGQWQHSRGGDDDPKVLQREHPEGSMTDQRGEVRAGFICAWKLDYREWPSLWGKVQKVTGGWGHVYLWDKLCCLKK